jgi:hypothetical protein
MNVLSVRNLTATAAVALGLACTALPAFAVSVTVNGQAVVLNPPPIERAGRVFVPLRGVFQQLGASVVYAGGAINATGNGNEIGLHIGSTQATVNGTPQMLDVAPFIVGASTYVPLRFVSQALGASVNFDGTNQIVALTTPGAVHPPVAPPPVAVAPPVPVLEHILRDEHPARDSTVQATRPTLQADFAQPVDANSVRLDLDGLDITSDATRSSRGFVYAPPSPLQSTRHVLEVRGRLPSGQPFMERYAFVSGTAAPQNSLTILTPREDVPSGDEFTVTGRTAPGAHVHIIAGASTSLGGFAFGTGSYAGDTTADGAGNFTQTVSLESIGSAIIGMTITSTDPATGESAEKKLQLRTK